MTRRLCLLLVLISTSAVPRSSAAQGSSTNDADCEVCLTQRAFDQCYEDARAVDDVRERLRTCQRDLDFSAGRRLQADRERTAVIRALRVENDVQREQLARQARELDQRITPARLVLWVGVALLTGYVAGRAHSLRID